MDGASTSYSDGLGEAAELCFVASRLDPANQIQFLVGHEADRKEEPPESATLMLEVEYTDKTDHEHDRV